ncbi:hypothetical protein TOPH_03825 [Tolypocladium ophioglossoides CBS 100239]|uniref:Aminoglycoside phosphotransferase domain-containing protein n=1 Tax=Tolypocladium ophioglossoides (strain CBS 100239) TaxID=1163406 RepID=A0A0L0NBZ5_TOLOC|nr:hypothetical protein TOPH_03825 [Tolypocladium ophioglossoides CBS 100239]
MAHPVYMTREFYGLPAPPGTALPTPAELLELCTKRHPRGWNVGLAYPPEAPIFWIKYPHVIWNELVAQNMAHEGLKRLQSPVRAPAVYYACEMEFGRSIDSFAVMEFVPGKIAAERLQDAEDSKSKDATYSLIALALPELHRIPVPPGSRPAAVNGGRIRHICFDMQEAPHHYRTVAQLEDLLNQFLVMARREDRIKDLTREPLVFCYSDIWLGNFIIDDSRITIIDFSEASILPSSFSKHAVAWRESQIRCNISHLVVIPTTNGVDNTSALREATSAMAMRSG